MKRKNISPWLYQLNKKTRTRQEKSTHRADIAVIGGGIAGIATAYFVLENTDYSVMLVEGNRIAHGATGHNGGFLASYFERTFSDMVAEFGIGQTIRGQQAVDSAWELLDSIRSRMKIKTPMWKFNGYTGCANLPEILQHLENDWLRKQHGLNPPQILVSQEIKTHISKKFHSLCKFISHDELLELLETTDKSYIGALVSGKGCMNSALFCHELVDKLQKKYRSRFSLSENTLIQNLVLGNNVATLHTTQGEVFGANKVILCTNGFEKITITNAAGEDINANFHRLVRGIVGYMAAYTEESTLPPAEISYLPKSLDRAEDVFVEEPYFYLTRRPFTDPRKKGKKLNLISIGGPETLMDDTNNYNHEHPYPQEAKASIDNFLRYTYKHGKKNKLKYQFLWHGLMGFTPNGIRCIGPEPLNPILYYNLGCNGVGLLPSIYGGYKISQQLLGKEMEPSIFDPPRTIRPPVVDTADLSPQASRPKITIPAWGLMFIIILLSAFVLVNFLA